MNPDLGEIILYQSEDGTSALDVHLKDETVWLSRQQMAELFGRDYKTVSKHISNVFNDGELRKKSVVANFATTGSDGKIYQVEYYNLDVVISAGYRVKSQRATQLRIWATGVLKDHLVRGYSSSFICGKTALPVSTIVSWWPWPCSPRPASRGIRSCWCG